MPFLKSHWIKIALIGNLAQALLFGQCTSERTSFLAFGDGGMGTPGQFQVAQAMTDFCRDQNCDFVALLGDNIYPNGVDSIHDPAWKKKFEEPYKDLEMNFYPTLGNHDYFGNVHAQWEYSRVNPKWKFPGRYYSFSECFVDFFVIDAERFDEEQAVWLDEAILTSQSSWKIVVGHRPVFSHGGHGDSKLLKDKLLPIIKNRVDFYLAGHDHDLEYIEKDYRPGFIVSGAAAESRPVGKGKSTLFSASVEGFVHLNLTRRKATIQFRGKEGSLLFEHSQRTSRKY